MPIRALKQALKAAALGTGLEVRRLVRNDLQAYLDLFGREAVARRAFFNISGGGHFGFGCGLRHPCWTNVDLDRPWGRQPDGRRPAVFDPRRGDLAHDLLSLQPLPIADGAAELVHSRVTIEHITDEAARVLFSEAHRILRPGGLLRVVAPNLELDFRALAANDLQYFSWADPSRGITMEQAFLAHFAANAAVHHADGAPTRITDEELRHALRSMGREDALDWCVSRCSLEAHRRNRGDHVNWWTPPKLERELRAAGFATVYLSGCEQSASPVLRNTAHFDNVFNRFMMYMEAVKL